MTCSAAARRSGQIVQSTENSGTRIECAQISRNRPLLAKLVVERVLKCIALRTASRGQGDIACPIKRRGVWISLGSALGVLFRPRAYRSHPHELDAQRCSQGTTNPRTKAAHSTANGSRSAGSAPTAARVSGPCAKPRTLWPASWRRLRTISRMFGPSLMTIALGRRRGSAAQPLRARARSLPRTAVR